MRDIIKKVGRKKGKTLAVFAGVHGDEEPGIEALKEVVLESEIEKGEVYFVFANPRAIEKGVRYIDKNLNRCFLKNNKAFCYEEKRAQELKQILDKSDALLDLHASNNPCSTPFIICEQNSYPLARIFDFKIISSGWDAIEPGATDGYMLQQGKPGLCLECGPKWYSDENKELAKKSIYQFFSYFGAIQTRVAFSQTKKKFIHVYHAVIKNDPGFRFVKEFHDFEILPPGKIFAYDSYREYKAGNNDCIIFPSPEAEIGDEVFILGKYIE